ncbi:hypothetical protein GCM10007989_05190 [Devosia pacifica]|uniref:Uncharacterized protein n=1 Tax=Devosia pacifica TaxID=1335967 RepID=A0A918RWC7_9HYPH|nr:hypothetical protein [Devosia pacifica]GHA13554.1 hypothetical protein GCM10007989_05190 [Devosia pacifica]
MPLPSTAQTIYRLIAQHAAALADLECTVDNEDAVTEAYDEAERQAFDALVMYVPTSTIELRRKIGYLLLHIKHTETLDRDQVEALLHSFDSVRIKSA